MKKLSISLMLALTVSVFYGQQAPADKYSGEIPSNWKALYFNMSKAERETFLANPNVDQEEVNELIRERKAKHTLPNQQMKMAGGEPDDFGCDMWYEIDYLNMTELDATNWELFSGGCGAGQGVDAYAGPINLPFDFCFYNTSYDVTYLSTKGALTFLEPMCDWTPDPYPGQSAFNMISGFWADFDFTDQGTAYYLVENNYAVFIFNQVGYWPGFGNLRNTFQMIITDGTSDLLPAGNNVGFFYGSMEWAHGGVGGDGGFNGPNPAVVGVDKQSGNDHIQFGTFNFNTANYDGPYGVSGIQWLTQKNFIFNTCGTENKPPVANYNNALLEGEASSLACDVITVCLNDTLELAVDYFGPEQGEIVTLDVDASDAANFTLLTLENGEVASWSGYFIGDAAYVGTHELVVTATDDGTPAATTTQTFVIEVLDMAAPEIEIIGNTSVCAGTPAELTAVPEDLDYYSWSSGCQGTTPNCDVYADGMVTVTGYDGQCAGTASAFVEVEGLALPFVCFDDELPLCNNDSIAAFACDPELWTSYEWSCFDVDNPDFDCNIYSDDLTADTLICGPGTYVLETTSENGCGGSYNFYVPGAITEFPIVTPDPICGPLEPFEFDGGFSDPGEGYLVIYFQDADGNYANGSWLNVTINGETSAFAMTESSFSLSNTDFPIMFGDEICVEYVPSPDDDGNNTITLFNCGNSNNALCGSFVGYSNSEMTYDLCDTSYVGQTLQWCGTADCTSEPLTGTWSQESCPEDGTFSVIDDFNTTFTPEEYGVYNLAFSENICNSELNFELIYNEAPEIDGLDPEIFWLCEGESATFEVDYDVETDCDLEITWSGVDSNNTLTNDGGGYESTEVTVTIENACGSVSQTQNVELQQNIEFNPAFDDELICDGDPLTLNPIVDDTPDLNYDWDPSQGGQSDPTVNDSGTYEVEVSNDCDTQTASVDIDFVAPFYTTWDGDIETDCDEGETTLSVNAPDGYSWVWSNGSTSDSQTFTSSEFITLTVTDDQDCGTYVSDYDLTVGTAPTPAEDYEDEYICPGECELFTPNTGTATSFSWTAYCADTDSTTMTITTGCEGPECSFCSDMVPAACNGETIYLTLTASNDCATEEYVYDVTSDLCSITIPNVFTPNGDIWNKTFDIVGIEK